MNVNNEKLKKYLYAGKNRWYTHMLLIYEQDEDQVYPRYILKEEDLDTIIKENNNNFARVIGIYDYSKDLDSQLSINPSNEPINYKDKDLVIKVLGSVAPYCKGDLNCSGFLIKYNNKNILLDAGDGITRNMTFPIDLNNFHCFISHYHEDHYASLLSLQSTALMYKNLQLLDKPLNIYLPKPDDYGINAYNLIRNQKNQYSVTNLYDVNSVFNIDDLTISFMENVHPTRTYSTKIENDRFKVVYTADTGYKCKDELVEFASNADLLICEASYVREYNLKTNAHLHAFEAATIAKEAKVSKLMLTHFTPDMDKSYFLDEAKEVFENTIVAEENKKLVLRR